MSEPTFVPLNTGDIKDDDGAVLDSFLIEVDNAPVPPASDPTFRPTTEPKPPNHLRTGYTLFVPTWDAVRILPPDPYRESYTIVVSGADGTSVLLVADESSTVGGNVSQCARLVPLVGGNTYVFPGHTGAVWVKASGLINLDVTWWAVTK